ncbi:CPBP family intramembrane glutamic endopeptidase [Microbacterium sp. NPDC096154]|uniref:CPBP family intramembrane glutamic endopeptidase n=1 Tax=Microbacterium sp. NPDC096154 TaxID=3155549 RepID=UPI0033203572
MTIENAEDRLARVPWPAVTAFAITAIALAWLVALPLWLGDGLASPLFGPLAILMMFTPAVATLVAVFALRSPHSARARFLGVWPLRPFGRTIWFSVVFLFAPALIVLAVAFASAALGLVAFDLVGFSGFAEALAPTLAVAGVDPASVPIQAVVLAQLAALPLGALVNCFVTFGEEIGWRGWLLPALRPLGVWPALLLSGAVWGVWHAPIILLGYNFGRPDVGGVLLMIAACVAWGVLFGWVRLRTASVWPAVTGHASLNAAGGAVMLFVAAGHTPDMSVVGPLGLVAWGVLAVVVVALAAAGQFRRGLLDGVALAEKPWRDGKPAFRHGLDADGGTRLG